MRIWPQLSIRIVLVSEVGQRLDPHIAIDRLVLEDKGLSLTDFEHFRRVLLLDVEVEQLVLQVLVRLAAVDDSVLGPVYLEQEKHVVLIDLAAVVALDDVVNSDLHFGQFVLLAARRLIRWVKPLLSLHLCVDPLLLDELALEQSVVELDLRETLQIAESSIAELGEDPLQEVCHQVVMVNEDLEEILDPDNLLRAQLQMLILLPSEVIAMGRVVYHGLNNLESHVAHVLHRDHPIVVLAALDHGDVLACRCRSLLILTLFEQLRTVHLKQVDLFPHIVDVPVDHDERLLVLVLTFDVDLDEKLPALLLLSQLDGVLPGRILLPTDLNRRIDIKDGGLSRVLDCQELLDLRLFVFLDIAIE